MALFGQILAALYQEDIVEEEDIRKWYSLPDSKGEHGKSDEVAENFKKCWIIGSHMIKQFDAQGSSESEEDSEEGEEEQAKEIEQGEVQTKEATETESEQTSEVETESEKDTEEGRHGKRRNTIVGPSAGVAALAAQARGGNLKDLVNKSASQNTASPTVKPLTNLSVESESDECLSDSTDARDAGISASEESSAANTEDEESEQTD